MQMAERTYWPLMIYRQNAGIDTNQLMESMGVTHNTINRIERGGIVKRVTAARYLQTLGIDLNNPQTIPACLKIINHGDRVAIEFQN